MKKWTLVLVLLLCTGLLSETYAWGKKKRKKAETATEVAAKPLTPYEKLFQHKQVERAGDRFIRLVKTEGKLYAEFPLKYLDREMLIASTVSETTNPVDNGINIGFKYEDPLHIRFTKKDSTVYLLEVEASLSYEQELQKAVKRTFGDPIRGVYPVLAYVPDSSAVVIDLTELLAREGKLKELKPLPYASGMKKIDGNLLGEATRLEEIKSFDDNLCVKTLFTYDVSSGLPMNVNKESMPLTIKVTRSILLLPEQKMQPRFSDSRVGIFLTDKKRISVDEDGILSYTLANRWRLVPKDWDAWKAGKPVEPVKPIVFYIDDAFPGWWKQPIKEGILRWNRAFEKIGFKNAIQVFDFPQHDPEFDPDNLKYSCVRYIPTAMKNSMGPSWVDPTTGEIINASVLIWNDVLKLINNWRFVQTAQIDESVRCKKMPDVILRESLAYVAAHEFGHCLGFMHNMAASAAYPVDSLRSESFTRKYGTTPSIMDYARFNYIAQPGDKGVGLTPPDLGPYDDFLVKWNYRPVPEAHSAQEERDIIVKWADEKAGDPLYRYGIQQMAQWGIWDPSALTEDLGDDPMKAGEYGIRNLQFILAHLDEWIGDDDDYSHREALYQEIGNQYMRYLGNVVYQVGGIYLTQVKAGTPGEKHRPVPRKLQQAALKWVLEQGKQSDWLVRPELKREMSLKTDLSASVQQGVIGALFGRSKHVLLADHIGENRGYSLKDFYDDFYGQVWRTTIGGGRLTQADRIMQREFVRVIGSYLSAGQPRESGAGQRQAFLTKLQATPEDLFFRESSFKSGYGWQLPVDLEAIDQLDMYYYHLALRVQGLLKSRVGQAGGVEKMHYQALLHVLDKVLKAD